MDRDGDSPKQNIYRCDRCDQPFTDLLALREHKRSDSCKTLPRKETSSPELPPRQEVDRSQHSDFPDFETANRKCIEVKRSPTEKRVHLSPDQGTSKSPGKVVKTPPEWHISSRPMGSPRSISPYSKVSFSPDPRRSMGSPRSISPYSKVSFSPDLNRSMSPSEKSTSPPPALFPKIIDSPPAARKLNFLPEQGTSKSPSKTSLEVTSKPMGSPRSKSPYSTVIFSPDLKRSKSPSEKSTSRPPAMPPKIIDSPPAARKLNFLPDQGTSKSPSKTSLEVSGNTRNSPGSSCLDRDSSMSPCTKTLESAKTHRLSAEQSWKEARKFSAHFASLYEEATKKKEKASKRHADAIELENSLTATSELKSFVADIKELTLAELLTALEKERCALQSLREAQRVERFRRDAASAAAVHEGAILEAAKSYNTDRDKYSAGSPIQKASFSPDQRTSQSSCKTSKTPQLVVSSNSPGSSSEVDLTQASVATLEEKTIAESAKSMKAEGDGNGTNLELQALEGDMKQSESNQTSKNDFPEKAFDCFTEKSEELKHSKEATNVPTAPDDKLDFTSASVTEEEKTISECDKSMKAEGDGIGTNLELQTLEGDMKQSESNQISKNDFPEKTLDCVTEEGEELKQSNLEEATNVLHAQDDRIDFTSASATHHGRWTQLQQSSLDVPDQHQGADAATSSSHVAESLKQSDKSPESTETTD